jgi:hypothetical protein
MEIRWKIVLGERKRGFGSDRELYVAERKVRVR